MKLLSAQIFETGSGLRWVFCRLDNVCLVAILSFLICSSAWAESNYVQSNIRSLQLSYEIFVGGFHAGDIDLGVRVESNTYELIAATKSAGLIDHWVGFRSHAQTRGVIRERRITPISHHVNNLWTEDLRFVRMGYGGRSSANDGPTYTVVHPLHNIDEREIVSLAQRRNTIDPLSAALRSAYSSNGWGDRTPCDDSIPVFDGRRRYNLIFKNGGTEIIDGPYFHGKARKCFTALERIVGFSRNPFVPRSKDLEYGEIWFADLVPSWPRIPVRFKADIGLGNALVHLKTYEVR